MTDQQQPAAEQPAAIDPHPDVAAAIEALSNSAMASLGQLGWKIREQREELARARAEILAVLDGLGQNAVRVREGNGPENIFASLAVTVAELQRERDRLRIKYANMFSALNSKQAKIDALMLEFCPGEMSAEQRAEWAANQRPSPPPEACEHGAHPPRNCSICTGRPAQPPSECYAGDSISKLLSDMRAAAEAAKSNYRDGVSAFVTQWIERLQSLAQLPPAVQGEYTELLGRLDNISNYEPDDAQKVIADAAEAIRDLAQYHAWAEPQVTGSAPPSDARRDTGVTDAAGLPLLEGDRVNVTWLAELGVTELDCEAAGTVEYMPDKITAAWFVKFDSPFRRHVGPEGIYESDSMMLIQTTGDEFTCSFEKRPGLDPTKTPARTTKPAMAMLPNDHHPGPRCSCRACQVRYPEENDVAPRPPIKDDPQCPVCRGPDGGHYVGCKAAETRACPKTHSGRHVVMPGQDSCWYCTAPSESGDAP